MLLSTWVLAQSTALFGQDSLLGGFSLDHRAPDNCPPCFNCMLPVFQCQQFASCNEYTGRCDCPAGFGGDDCSEPLCGALSDGPNRPRREGDTCDCSDGWSGINCNMCTRDDSCDPFVPEGEKGTCYQGGILVNQNYQMCDVTNRKILDILNGKIPQGTFACNRTAAECKFQFWVDQRESFYCGLDQCEFDVEAKENTKITRYRCPNISCACVPDRMLCGEAGSIDITDFLTETIKGPGYFECDTNKRSCSFSEPSMNDLILSVFGDPHITLECSSSECVHHTEVPGYTPPVKENNKKFVIASFVGALTFLLAGVSTLRYFFRLSEERNQFSNIELPSDSDIAKIMAEHKPASLQFEGISYTDNGKRILNGVFGSVESGQVLAILGGSGAGKTTLLDILAGKSKRGVVEGSVFVNGKVVSDKKYKRIVGFVGQEDHMMPTLTVYETVVTSALLRLPKSMSDDTKKLRALETMNELGILGLRDQLVGDETNRGISGGEKRRLTIACELVTSPSILFLDEPTSGLDAYNAYNVVESLVQLARTYNRTVVITIHQPRSNIVSLFDKLILLAKGQLVFSGPSLEAADFFRELGYACPAGYNVADYLIDLTMSKEGPESSGPESSEGQSVSNNSDDDIHAPLVSGQEVDSTREWRHFAAHRQDFHTGTRAPVPVSVERLSEWYNGSSLADLTRQNIETIRHEALLAEENDSGSDIEDFTGYSRIGLLKQFSILSERTFKNLYRNPQLLLTHYVIAVLLALFCGVLYYNIANDISGFQNRLGLFFFLLTLFGFSTLSTLNLFAEERIIFVRERANGYYNPLAYYLAKVLFDIIPLRVLPPILLGFIIYPLAGLSTDQGAFWKFLLTLVLFNLTAASTCLSIGILIDDVGVANLVGSLVMLFSLLFAGLFLNQSTMPAATTWFKYLSIFHYAYEALAVNEVRYLTLTEKKYGLSIEVPGATILSTFGFDSGALWRDVSRLAIFFVIFLVAGYIAMHVWLRERR